MQKFTFNDEFFVRHEDVVKLLENIKKNLRKILDRTFDGCQRDCLDCGAANEQASIMADKIKFFELFGAHYDDKAFDRLIKLR
jgi:hypothetical protein